MLWKRVFSGKNSLAISEKSFIGQVGVINLGTATNKNAVEISLYDERGMKHYIMGRVALPNISVGQSEKVYILHKKKNDYFLVLPYMDKAQKSNKSDFFEKESNNLTKEINSGL
jgi:hypothetical protein